MGRLSELADDEAAHLRGGPPPGTSADEALQLQRALDRQREDIAAKIAEFGCTAYECYMWRQYHDHTAKDSHSPRCPVAIGALIRADGRKE